MQWIIPGTTLEAAREEADLTQRLFRSLFLAGGLTLSQVSGITGLEPYTIQNWVKRGFLSPPRGKRYTMEQVCRIININILKGAMPLEQIVRLMTYLNGDLADESDDLVDDAVLLFRFVELAAREPLPTTEEDWVTCLDAAVARDILPLPGAREKLMQVLRIMLTAWQANSLKNQAAQLMEQLTQTKGETQHG